MRARRIGFAIALALCLALVGLWTIRSDRPQEASQRAPSLAPRAPSVELAPGDTPVEPVVSTPSPPPSPSSRAPSPAFGTFRGRVIDAATRAPVRDFVVEFLGRQATKVGDEAPGARTFRADDGRFEWEYLPPGQWTVTTSARGYQRFDLPHLQVPRGDATPEIVLPLRRGHTLRGRVYDEATGVGIPSVSVGFRESDVGRFEGNFRMRVRVTSAKDGSFALEGVPPGRITLEVWAQDHASRELDVLVGDDLAPLEIALSTGGTIAGRLTASDGVTPVAGAAGLNNLDTHSGFSRRTGKSGEFLFQHLTPGRYLIHGRSKGGSASREVVLASNQRMEDVVLAVGVGSSIRGVVSGLRAELLERVSISVRRDDSEPGAEGRLDDRGAYVIKGVEPGRVTVAADVSMQRQLTKTVDVPPDSDITVDFVFPPGARLSGRVTRDGKPVRGVWLSPRPVVQQPLFSYGASTSTNGEYVIEDLAPGDYHLFADRYKSKLVRVSGDTVFDIEIPLAQLSGRVVEAGGKVPVVGAQVEAWGTAQGSPHIYLQDRTDHFGQFALAGLEAGDFTLSAYKPGYEMFRERISYATPVADMTLQLRRNKGVEIRVREAGSGKAMDSVYVAEMVGENYGIRLQLRLDDEGEGHLPAALAGRTLSFGVSGHAPIVIPAWSGQSLELHFERQATQPGN